ncbi:PepSY domain-containing protein [Brevibacillus porteri]|uniref:Peptidase n=1 Tax=Brevibacillus porteri TaxID=2126350 RepID=A0ABX5FP08_9BACL|nr:PepSY domain-containing protein [Brevibacillus porteri]MED1800245.1 PepSY domain-containing protein [Brevibacillus porteri]MED2133643.1 PepSY domain-containing protein [Brevibacillus porteri]MED2747335.1 PepSY domain-containing protein [Brevibacillus porteri]MED2813200.1 PepSY domain-containing protein [Brevibacillus porteri]MED2892435.1 PepSY domain-containing protein [Brevibacillus porteri]
MNKKWKIGLLASFLLVTTAFGMQRIFASMDLQSLSEEEVKQIVTTRYPGKIESISMTDVGENSIYNLQLLNERGTYSVMVNAYTGEIIDLKELSLVAATAQPKANETATKPTQPGSNPTASTAPQPNNGGKDASGSATKPAGTGTVGTVASAKQQPATTQTQKQQPKPNQSANPPAQPQTKITEQQAKQIATERTSGGKIDDVDLIETKSGAVYRVITKKDSKTVDVRIHAITGKVLSTTTIDNSSTDDDPTPADKNGSAPADTSSSDDTSTIDTDDDELDDGDDD